jgi:hypothetical protein
VLKTKNKDGEYEYSKRLLQGSIDDLKNLNGKLYKEIEKIKKDSPKEKPAVVVTADSKITLDARTIKDNTLVQKNDSLYSII